MWESASAYMDGRERKGDKSEVVLCIDLYSSVKFVIKGEDVYHFLTQPCWITSAPPPPPSQECPLTVTVLSHKYASIFEQVLKGMKSLSVSPQRMIHNREVKYGLSSSCRERFCNCFRAATNEYFNGYIISTLFWLTAWFITLTQSQSWQLKMSCVVTLTVQNLKIFCFGHSCLNKSCRFISCQSVICEIFIQ